MRPRSALGYLEVLSAQMRQRDCHAAAIMQVLGELRFDFVYSFDAIKVIHFHSETWWRPFSFPPSRRLVHDPHRCFSSATEDPTNKS